MMDTTNAPQMLTMAQAAVVIKGSLMTVDNLIRAGVIVGAELQEPAWKGQYLIPATALETPAVLANVTARCGRMNAELDQIEQARRMENAPE
jgi:hypothetical protein